MILDFGKFKGDKIQDTPLSYIIFLAGYVMHGCKREPSKLGACKWIQENKRDVHNFAKSYLDNICWHCEGKLVPVGNARINGAAHDDWDCRYLHKKCWRELKNEEERS
jgi:hypothetical protein